MHALIAVALRTWTSDYTPQKNHERKYLSMPQYKSNHISKKGPSSEEMVLMGLLLHDKTLIISVA